MTKRILIDAVHGEEIRMVVLEDGKVLDYDVQTKDKTQNRGNIYVGVVNRVEPSLQSAFVEYGGNRNGFLPMSEVNPNFYNKLSAKEKAAVLEEYSLTRAEKYNLIKQAREMLALAEQGHVFPVEEIEETKPVVNQEVKENTNSNSNNNDRKNNSQNRQKTQTKKVYSEPKQEKVETTEEKTETPKVAAKTQTTATEKPKTKRPAKQANKNTAKKAASADQIRFDFNEDKAPEPKTVEKSVEVKTAEVVKEVKKIEEPVKKVVKEVVEFDNKIVSQTVTAEFGDPKPTRDASTIVIPEQEVVEEENKKIQVSKTEIALDIEEEISEDLDENLDLVDDIKLDDDRQYIKLKTKTNAAQIEELKGYLQPLNRRYSIEKVLKVGQKILVQVNKEERGNKGAALTSNISLPGRYSVLMPNVANAGGVSRKITDPAERSELRTIVDAIDIDISRSLIVRTAAIGQGQAAIERDYKALSIQWDNILAVLDKENSPVCVHNDSNIITKAIRDIVSTDIDEIVISGEEAYKEAKSYVKAIMPNYAKQVREHRAQTPLFSYFKVETELHKLHTTRVDLESGAYLIINPTEALVSIDINSGKSTGEKTVEDTALKTNVEAAHEIAKQLRLRDLSGLIVIDFIDMDSQEHERQVERALRNSLRNDRAKTQVGFITEFGLLEMSRQRIRPTLEESMFKVCTHCNGTGSMRSPASSAITILRGIEEERLFTKADIIEIYTHTEVAVYMLNHKRDLIKDFETKYKIRIVVNADNNYISPDHKVDLVRVNHDGTVKRTSQEFVLREKAEDLNHVDSELINSFMTKNQIKTIDTKVSLPFEDDEEERTVETKTEDKKEKPSKNFNKKPRFNNGDSKSAKAKSAFKRWWNGK
jgi:ribonuclease E